LGLLHHPDPSLSCNSFWGLSRRERCLDNPQKLLKKARIGVMQKNWLTNDQASTRFGNSRGGRDALVGSLVPFVRRVRCAAAAKFVTDFADPWRWWRWSRISISRPRPTHLDNRQHSTQLNHSHGGSGGRSPAGRGSGGSAPRKHRRRIPGEAAPAASRGCR
jgi:hypothetical protein